ncbi:MAG: 23S rRNA (adenine(2503)-C(2))-methyltransferase RlmN [Candidatus Omnitrophota bacterium]
MADIYSLSLTELTARFAAMGEPVFRAKQLFDWLYVKKASSFDIMSSFSRPLREKLAAMFPFPVLKEHARHVALDGTVKFLFEMADGQRVETVYIPTAKRGTLCVSSQAGCKFSCGFCASGLGGFARNLTTGEIMGEVLGAMRAVHPKKVTHIVFMGTGEPFDNYDHVLKAVRLLNAKEGINIAARRITISTCGVIPGIERFATEKIQVELCVSLHASNDLMRAKIMPVNAKYPLKDLMAVCRRYAKVTGRQVTFEYILIKDLTCTADAARELIALMKGWLSKVNLIPYNPVKEFVHRPPTAAEAQKFKDAVERGGVVCTLRSPRGDDVSAACGQLRNSTRGAA